jgi:hypothetical protein
LRPPPSLRPGDTDRVPLHVHRVRVATVIVGQQRCGALLLGFTRLHAENVVQLTLM